MSYHMHGSHVFLPTAPALLSCIACTTARSLLNYARRFCLNFDPVSGIRTFRSDRWSVVEPTVWTNRASRAIPLPPRASPPYLTERKKERKTSLVRYSEFQFNSWHHTPPDSETRVLNQNFFGGVPRNFDQEETVRCLSPKTVIFFNCTGLDSRRTRP
jgi:hypothetical protein